MNFVDVFITHFLNQFAHRSRAFDLVAYALTSRSSLKGGAIVMAFWWIWFKQDKRGVIDRQIVLATFASAVAAVIAGRLLAFALPFRLRPLQTPELHFQLPYGVTVDMLRNWSSFPSDHAMTFFALSTGLWFASRLLGAVFSLYVAFFVALPRVYIGLHYGSDVIAGGLIGAVFAYVANVSRIRAQIAAPFIAWENRHAPSFYVSFFLFSEGLMGLFDSIRQVAAFILSYK